MESIWDRFDFDKPLVDVKAILLKFEGIEGYTKGMLSVGIDSRVIDHLIYRFYIKSVTLGNYHCKLLEITVREFDFLIHDEINDENCVVQTEEEIESKVSEIILNPAVKHKILQMYSLSEEHNKIKK